LRRGEKERRSGRQFLGKKEATEVIIMSKFDKKCKLLRVCGQKEEDGMAKKKKKKRIRCGAIVAFM